MPKRGAVLQQTCPICAEPGLTLESRWPHSQCPACGHVWIDGSIPAADNEYFESDDYARWRTDSPVLQDRQLQMADERINWLGTHVSVPGRVLEFGCSTGEGAAALANRGWSAWALDPSTPAINIARDRHPEVSFGVGISPAEAGVPEQGYDLVMAFHVVEHIPDPHRFVEAAAESLSTGGLLYLRVPNWDSWSRRLFGDRWPDNMAEHLHHFSATSMQRLLNQHGFEVLRVETKGQSRSWIGGARRMVSSDWSANETMPTTGDRSQAILSAANTVARPWFRLEERYRAGAELLVLAKRHRPMSV